MPDLICGHLNVRSLVRHFNAVTEIVHEMKFHLFLISESWLTKDIENNLVSIAGYNFVRCDRSGRGGGVAMYIRSDIPYKLLICDRRNEQLWIRICLSGKNVAVGVVYRSQAVCYRDFLDSFENILTSILPTVDEIVCMGDFNINLLDTNNYMTKYVSDMFDSLGLNQLVDRPTRIGGATDTLLDYIVVSDPSFVTDVQIVPVVDVADHELTVCKVSMFTSKSDHIFRTVRDFKNINLEQFESDLSSIPWKNIFDAHDINSKVSFLTDSLNLLLDIHAPFKTVRLIKPTNPWITDSIKAIINDRNKALKKYKRTKNQVDWQNYKSLRNMANSVIKTEKKSYYAHLFGHKNRANWWSAFNKLGSKKDILLPTQLTDVNKINDYFVDSIPQLTVDQSLVSYYRQNRFDKLTSECEFKPVTEIDVLKVISSIKSKATGVDGINISVILMTLPFLLPYYTHIINFCLLHSVYPELWKKARVIPLPKRNNPACFNDLRPISVLPTMSKILEKIIYGQIREHTDDHKIISMHQSGFKPRHSCATALTKITDDIFDAWDKSRLTVLILFDYSRAFDTLNHELLLAIFHYIGLSEASVQLLSSFLVNRHQRVEYAGMRSIFLPVFKGVPQGSILGPLFFTVYVQKLPDTALSCSQHFYADDTQYYISFSPDESEQVVHAINYDLSNLLNFSRSHSLQLNSAKSSLIVFGREKDRNMFKTNYAHLIVMENEVLSIKTSVRNLGLLMDENLRFTEHVNKCLRGCYAQLKSLYQHRHMFARKLKIILCNSLVLSRLDFCDSIYGPCLTYVDKQRIQKLQNSCLRFVFGIRKYQRVSFSLKIAKWLNMEDRRFYHSVSLYYDIIKNKSPQYLYLKINFRTDVHTLNLRFKGLLTPPLHSTQLYKRSFSYTISKYFNILPLHLKVMGKHAFKKSLFHLLFNNLLRY